MLKMLANVGKRKQLSFSFLANVTYTGVNGASVEDYFQQEIDTQVFTAAGWSVNIHNSVCSC